MTTAKKTAEATVVPEVVDYKSMSLTQRMAKARELIGGRITKEGANTSVGDGYKFVRSGDVAFKAGEALAATGVIAVPSYTQTSVTPFLSRSGTQQFLTTLAGDIRFGNVEDEGPLVDGIRETIMVSTVGHGTDSGDKGAYKAMTGALKYAILHALNIATGDDPEETREEPATTPTATVIPGAVAPRPADTQVVGTDPSTAITTSQSRMLFARSNKLGLEVAGFRAMMYALTGKRKSGDLNNGDVHTLVQALEDPAQVARFSKPGAEFGADEVTPEAVAAATGGSVVPTVTA